MTETTNQQRNKQKKTRVKFTKEDDEKLTLMVEEWENEHTGKINWNQVADKMGNKTAKQCRDRYTSYLKPGITNAEWTVEEDNLLIQKMWEFGNRWTTIASFFPNRGVNNVKNRWYRKLASLFPTEQVVDLSMESCYSNGDLEEIIKEEQCLEPTDVDKLYEGPFAILEYIE